MLIDLHAHHFTRGMFDLDPHWGPSWTKGTLKVGDWWLGMKKLPSLTQIADEAESDKGALFDRYGYEFRHQIMDKLGIDKVVLSCPPPMYMYQAGDFGVRFAKVTNDEFAAYCDGDPDSFLWWAHLPMHRPAEAANELERAVGMGAVGFNTGGANLGGLDLHDREMDVLWEKVAELDVPVFVHGHPQVIEWLGDEDKDVFDTTIALGYMYDESRAFWHLTCGGVLDRFPTLKFYVTHAGGMTPYQYERFGELHKTLAPDSVNERPVVEYMSSFYFDPMIPSPVMRRAIVDIIGVDHLVYGTNLMGSDQIEIDLTEGIGLSEDDREKIRSGNAIKLLKLENRVSA